MPIVLTNIIWRPNILDSLSEITFRHYSQGDEEGIIKLLDRVYDGWPKIDVDPLDYWRWKYRDSPYWRNDVSVAVDGEEIVGCKHSVYMKLKMGDEVLDCTIGSDLAIKQECRGRRLSIELSSLSSKKKKELGYDFSFFVTSNPILIRKYGERQRRASLPHQVRVYALIKDIDEQIEKMPVKNPRLVKTGFKIVSAVNRFTRSNDGERGGELVIRRIHDFDTRAEEFYRKVAHEYDFIVERSLSYLRWRYTDPRKGRYEIMVAEEKGEIQGYCVVFVNRFRKDYPLGYVVDLLTSPNRADVMSALLGGAVRYFDDNDVNIVTALVVGGSPLEKVMNEKGFLDSRERLNVFLGTKGLKMKNETVQKTLRKCTPEKLHFCYGDIDTLPVNVPNKVVQ